MNKLECSFLYFSPFRAFLPVFQGRHPAIGIIISDVQARYRVGLLPRSNLDVYILFGTSQHLHLNRPHVDFGIGLSYY